MPISDVKYGVLDFDLTVKSYWDESWNKKALLNIGDAAEYLVVERLLLCMGISEKQIVKLSIADLTRYKGEKLIVPLNIAFDSYVGYNHIFDNISDDIVPVFLGISLTSCNLTERQLMCLKKFAPIGCRDERTYLYLLERGITCYLNGCTASILDVNEIEKTEKPSNKILFIDVPRSVLKYVPDNIKKDIVFVQQEMYCSEDEFKYQSPLQWAKEILGFYRSPRMIVTSRFHGAVLGLANNVPVILTLEKYTFRFSWLRNYMQIYTEGQFNEINWNASYCDYKKIGELIRTIAEKRILNLPIAPKILHRITELQQCLRGDEKSSSSNIYYYSDALEEIDKKWKSVENIKYGFWGINANTDVIYEYISQKYPNAKLVDIYDMYRPVEFAGIGSVSPFELKKRADDDSYYVIITAYLASRIANDIFRKTAYSRENAILCEREFIEKEMIDL